MLIWYLLLNVLAVGSASAALSTESGTLKRSIEAPGVATTITSAKMTVRNQDSQAVFEGAVVLTRGSLVVRSDRMVVLFHSQKHESAPSSGKANQGDSNSHRASPNKNGAASTMSTRSVSRIEATAAVAHQVKIEYENGNATCQQAVYFVEGEKVVLTGDPVAWERGTRVSGRQITIYLAEERSVVEGSSHVRIEGEGANTP